MLVGNKTDLSDKRSVTYLYIRKYQHNILGMNVLRFPMVHNIKQDLLTLLGMGTETGRGP